MALPHARSGQVVPLPALESGLTERSGFALVKSDRFEAMRLNIPAGTTVPAHQLSGYLTLYCLEGRLSLAPVEAELGAGDWVYLDRGTSHGITAIEDASLLLTIIFDDP